MSWNNFTVRELERESIRSFVASAAAHFDGRVLDYGCGKQPYRGIVEDAGGEYVGYDRVDYPGNVSEEDLPERSPNPLYSGEGPWAAILCTQILQYVPDVRGLLSEFRFELIGPKYGVLVLTYATNWAEVEREDLHRFTQAGMERLLHITGYSILRHERRASLNLSGFDLALGYGVIARPT